MKNLTLLAVTVLLLTACGGAESEAKKAVAKAESEAKKVVIDSLKDPDSAKFGKFTIVNEVSACLTVNARNSMGGYTGNQQALLTKVENSWIVLGIEEYSHESCIDLIKRVSKK